MHAHLAGIPAVGQIGADRPDRRAETRAGAVANREAHLIAVVPRVAGVDERGDAPVLAHPMGVLGARHHHAASADDGVALAYAEAFVGVAAHRLVAADAE